MELKSDEGFVWTLCREFKELHLKLVEEEYPGFMSQIQLFSIPWSIGYFPLTFLHSS